MRLIARDELRAKLERHDGLRLVMTLPAHAFEAKRIPTSIRFESREAALAKLDPDDEIVVYCADVRCPASIRAYRFLEQAGYTNIRRYAGGIADWEGAGYPLEHGPTGSGVEREKQRPEQPGELLSVGGRHGGEDAFLVLQMCLHGAID